MYFNKKLPIITIAIALLVSTLTVGAAFAATNDMTAENRAPSSDTSLSADQTITVAAANKAAKSYRVLFKSNGGKGAMSVQTIVRDNATALKANKFTRNGYTFAGWNTKKNGKGQSFKNKAKVGNLAKAGKTVALYAQWKKVGKAPVIKTKGFTLAIPKYWRGKVKYKTSDYGPYPKGTGTSFDVGMMTLVYDKHSETLVEIHWAKTSEFKQRRTWDQSSLLGKKVGKKYTVEVFMPGNQWIYCDPAYFKGSKLTNANRAIMLMTGGKSKSGGSYGSEEYQNSLKNAASYLTKNVLKKIKVK